MSDTVAGILQAGLLILLLGLAWRPLGTFIAHVFTSEKHLRVEAIAYRLGGIDAGADQRWASYARSALAFSAFGLVLLYALQRLQGLLPLSLGMKAVPPWLAFNTAVSFVANTNWQAYSGEALLGHLVQMAGLAVQNFVSAAVGLAVAIALSRGLTRDGSGRIGNFWTDLVRGTFRVLLPIAFVGAVLLVACGVVQNLSAGAHVTTLLGQHGQLTGGPVASQESIKLLGTNGGGFYNANSAHPFENPNPLSNLIEIFLLLLIPVALTRTYGELAGSVRQGAAILGTMVVLWLVLVVAVTALELAHPEPVGHLAGASMEGKEVRFGVPGSSLFAVSTTGTSTGAVNSFHSSYGGVAGGLLILNMGLGEVAPGGVGSGLYGILVLAILSVFVAGLMVGRTPEYLHKKVSGRQMTLVSLNVLTMPLVVLIGTGVAVLIPSAKASMLNAGPHGLSEVLYAFMSATNNNGSAFAGLSANTNFFNIGLGLAMLLGRFVPMVLVLALAGSFADQRRVPETTGTLPTHGPVFVTLLTGVTVIVAGLTFFPVLALGPLAEGLA